MSTPTPAAYTVAEFEAVYRIGHTKFYQERNSGRLITRKLGRRTLILREDAEAWWAKALASPVLTPGQPTA